MTCREGVMAVAKMLVARNSSFHHPTKAQGKLKWSHIKKMQSWILLFGFVILMLRLSLRLNCIVSWLGMLLYELSFLYR